MSYVRKIQRNGASIISPIDRQRPPWIPHTDPDLLAWMRAEGLSSIDEIPVVADYRPDEKCERCGARGVETHHWAPKEWFGKEEADRWPTGELCRPCHRFWHHKANMAAVKVTLRHLRARGLHRQANQIESAWDTKGDEAA